MGQFLLGPLLVMSCGAIGAAFQTKSSKIC